VCILTLQVSATGAQEAEIVMTDLGTLGGGYAHAWGINDLGQVVGYMTTTYGDMYAFLLEDGVMTELGTLGGSDSWAYGINNLGQVVGSSTTTETDGETHAVLWGDGVITDLGTFGGQYSVAYGINNLGQVVGMSVTTDGKAHAFLWEDGVMTDLGALGGGYSEASGINELSQVVGWSTTTDGEYHAVMWTVTTTPLTPDELTENLIADIGELVESGTLNDGQGNSLTVKLENTLKHLDKDNTATACNMLNAFINHVNSLVEEGVLTLEEGQALLSSVDEIAVQICQ